jgi:hypothetical protein
MAYGLSIQAFIRIIDSKGKEGRVTFNFPLNTDIAVLKTAIREAAGQIDALIKGQVIGAGIELVASLAGATLKASAIAGSDIEEGVRFSWGAASGGQTQFRIPTVDESWLNDAGVLEYVSGDDVDDFIQRIIVGSNTGANWARPSDAYSSDIEDFLGGTESFLASRA